MDISRSVLVKNLEMLRRLVEGSTHTSDAFVDFAFDLLQYSVPKYGYSWEKPADFKRRTKKLFRENFGDVVILFRERHSNDFNEKFTLIKDMETSDDILLYVASFQEKIFKGNIPLMEFIAYCAFLLDMALICMELEDPDLLFNIVDDTADVFYQYIKPYFTIVGGWFSLYRVAKQYERYVTTEPQNNPVASATEENWDLLCV
ncbi:hypothetical protein HNY73_014982 [Argiope bruennichi]|uniref:Uncharacterized protein n=1 Tax=Argiope bruennichi TaxID=94029 RepID=A0A8T0ES82_ARGBR|nr:hypothetical protein HNY73_014982 [Argiope bruennichi]